MSQVSVSEIPEFSTEVALTGCHRDAELGILCVKEHLAKEHHPNTFPFFFFFKGLFGKDNNDADPTRLVDGHTMISCLFIYLIKK